MMEPTVDTGKPVYAPTKYGPYHVAAVRLLRDLDVVMEQQYFPEQHMITTSIRVRGHLYDVIILYGDADPWAPATLVLSHAMRIEESLYRLLRSTGFPVDALIEERNAAYLRMGSADSRTERSTDEHPG